MIREPGYYWAKFKPNALSGAIYPWTVGEWRGFNNTSGWDVVSDDRGYDDSDFIEIGPKIELPVELESPPPPTT